MTVTTTMTAAAGTVIVTETSGFREMDRPARAIPGRPFFARVTPVKDQT